MTTHETCALIVDAETARYVAEALAASTPEAAFRAWQGVYRSFAVASAIRALVPRYTGLSHGSPGRWPGPGDDS